MSTVTWKDVPTRTVSVGGTSVFQHHEQFVPELLAFLDDPGEDGPERDECWALANTVYSGFGSYQQLTERRIPIAVLERRDAT